MIMSGPSLPLLTSLEVHLCNNKINWFILTKQLAHERSSNALTYDILVSEIDSVARVPGLGVEDLGSPPAGDV